MNKILSAITVTCTLIWMNSLSFANNIPANKDTMEYAIEDATENTVRDEVASSKYKIYISQLVKHPALDETTRGIIEALNKHGYEQGKNLDLQIELAQGNVGLAAQIAQKFVSSEPDIVVGVATVAAQSLYKYAKEGKTKLVFSSVTDPIGAQLALSLMKPGNNSSGVSNYVELGPQLAMFKQLLPNMKKLGFLYNPGEMNSLSLVKLLTEECPKYGLKLILQTAAKSSEVKQSASNLASKVDAIFISNDNTALSAIRSVINEATQQGIPVFVSDTDMVAQGALAALGPNQYEIGVQTAEIIIKTLEGHDINQIPVGFPSKTELVINKRTAKTINLVIPNSVFETAVRIIE